MRHRIAALLAREHAPAFFIVDGARDRAISRMVRNSGFRYQSLYDGEAAEQMAPFGPYLVALPADEEAVERWAGETLSKSFGVYLSCTQPFDSLRKHLRRFLMVELEDNRKVYFRFYDPRVLRLFLPNCTHEEWMRFFGPVETYFAESEDACAILRFRREADEPKPERLDLFH